MKRLVLLTCALMISLAITNAGSVHGIQVKDIDGKSKSLDAYKGKVLLIVNVASKSGKVTSYLPEQNCLISSFVPGSCPPN